MTTAVAEYARYQYQADYLPDPVAFREQILAKTVRPYQVEWQPGPPVGGKICWLECPYCYGGSAALTDERLPLSRAVAILDEILAGGVRKVIFAGYATDPLFSPDLEELVTVALNYGAVVGFNTKLLRLSERLLRQVAERAAPLSYFNVSVDAGSNETYRHVHAARGQTPLYDRVRANVARLAVERRRRAGQFELMATYLVSWLNAESDELRRFVRDFQAAGADVLRFTFAQMPRGGSSELLMVPSEKECAPLALRLRALAAELDAPACRVLFTDADQEHDLFRKPRTLPCVARWVYPTVGYDGWLYHCSQSAAPNFRGMALGNLAERGFWDLYYDYDPAQLAGLLEANAQLMAAADCRCDRKEHLVNLRAAEVLSV